MSAKIPSSFEFDAKPRRHGYARALKIGTAGAVLAAALKADRAAEAAHRRSLPTEAEVVTFENPNSDHGLFFLFGCGTPARTVTAEIAERLRARGFSYNIIGIVYPEADFENAPASVAARMLKAKRDLGIRHQKEVAISFGGAMRTILHQDPTFRRAFGRSAALVLHSPVFDYDDLLTKPQRIASLAGFVEHSHSRSLEVGIPKAVRAIIHRVAPGELHVEPPNVRPASMEQLVGQIDHLKLARSTQPESAPLQGVADEVYLIQCGIDKRGRGDDVVNMRQSAGKYETAVGATPFIPITDTAFPGIHAAIPESIDLVADILASRQLVIAA